jgi:hypothetical protein
MAQTSQQIVSLACSIAKCPGYIVQGGQYMNIVLQDLWMHYDLKVNRVTQSLVVQANSNGPFNLEADYARTYDMFYLQNNLPYFLHPVSAEEFDQEFKDPSISNYPYEYQTDLSTQAQVASGTAGLFYIYPQSSGQITLTHRYMVQQPDITNPQTSAVVPWFTDADYLIKAIAYRLMDITGDDRRESFMKSCADMLRTHLIMEGDEQAIVKAVKLDPRTFRGNRSVKPTKVTG